MTHYEVTLRDAPLPMPVDAEKFEINRQGYTVFYARPAPGEPFEEIATFSTRNVINIEEKRCP